MRLFIDALWSPAGKGLTSWLSFVTSNCEVFTFPLVSWSLVLDCIDNGYVPSFLLEYKCDEYQKKKHEQVRIDFHRFK